MTEAPGTLLPGTHHTCFVPLQRSLFCFCRQLLSRVSHPARCHPPSTPLVQPTSKANPQSLSGEGLARSVRSKAYSCLSQGMSFSPIFPMVAAPTPALCACWAQPQGFLLRPPFHPTHPLLHLSAAPLVASGFPCVPPASPGTCWLWVPASLTRSYTSL